VRIKEAAALGALTIPCVVAGVQLLPFAVAAEERPARTIAVTINGTTLSSQTRARVVEGRALVPMRSSMSALRLHVESRGETSVLALKPMPVFLNNGSCYGHIGARVVRFETAVRKIDGVVYVPLGLFRTLLGAVTRYDARNAHVTILSAFPPQGSVASEPPPVQGTIANLDLFSKPPVLSLVTNNAVRVISLRPDLPVYVEDVIVGTRGKEGLSAIHVGDLASVHFTKDGRISEIDDSFRSRSGVIAAVSPRAFAFADGHVVMPSRASTITLNAGPATIGRLQVGDAATVRSNPESLEVREIIASREIGSPTSPAAVVIRQCIFTPTHPLRSGQELQIFLRGTPHGQADFNIGTSVVAVPMREVSPGLYAGRYLVASGANFRKAAVVGELRVGDLRAQAVTAPIPFEAAGQPPQVIETAPREGQSVNNTRPAIYAVFQTPTGIAIDPSSISLFVGGRNVTSRALRAGGYVSYLPESDLAAGAVPVLVTLSDMAGNTASYRWTFTEGP